MKKFLIKVNGNQYEVEVEEVRDGVPQPAAAVAATPAPVAAPTAAAVPASAAAKVSSEVPAGAAKVIAPMPGTILKVSVKTGDTVKKGQVLLILEAMKMENEIVAAADGTIASVNVSSGASVNAGDILVSLS